MLLNLIRRAGQPYIALPLRTQEGSERVSFSPGHGTAPARAALLPGQRAGCPGPAWAQQCWCGDQAAVRQHSLTHENTGLRATPGGRGSHTGAGPQNTPGTQQQGTGQRESLAQRWPQDETKHSSSKRNLYCILCLWKYVSSSLGYLDFTATTQCSLGNDLSLVCRGSNLARAGLGVPFFRVT